MVYGIIMHVKNRFDLQSESTTLCYSAIPQSYHHPYKYKKCHNFNSLSRQLERSPLIGVSLFRCYQSECVTSQVRKISAIHNHAREKAICNIAGESKLCTFDIHHRTNVRRISQVNLPSSHFSTTTITKQ